MELQRTPEWYAAKLGKVGASRVADLMARTKTGYGASRANYMAELLCELLTGANADSYESAAMVWGREREPEAKAAYCFMTGAAIDEAGFVAHPSITMAGASPDGLIGEDGLVEIKCPNSATHIETLLSQVIEGRYLLQMQFQMACTGRQWCDFISFDPRLPPEMQLWIKRIYRQPEKIKEIETEVHQFLGELSSRLDALRTRYLTREAA
jgi:putative phage-type endonuclease